MPKIPKHLLPSYPSAAVVHQNMTVMTLASSTCAECSDRLDCTAVRCPKCRQVRLMDMWEVWDNFAVCPNGCVVLGYQCLPGGRKILCKKKIEEAIKVERVVRGKRRKAKRG